MEKEKLIYTLKSATIKTQIAARLIALRSIFFIHPSSTTNFLLIGRAEISLQTEKRITCDIQDQIENNQSLSF